MTERRSGTREISIHAPAWGATPEMKLLYDSIKISIHAPAWGATKCLRIWPSSLTISIHAPAWGATGKNDEAAAEDVFQSTRPRGARLRECAAAVGSLGFQSTRPRGARHL
ncbi:hypothetical protein SELSPUOL_02676 [Selenomonas sputigena ATCC 35185]|uniref:Uncharacterized protein n=1 Tax=Selenomonas sputigena (strain ATCC 35185 / DSM 20758 / CCUG 44933 / VPI D19B-28) TaxID=546271 RepID=C9LYW5_SELS3|nr:hypothetical protein SELSPUOL_02676 [Selenomonas sputigena ATCC 35185]